MDKSLIVAGAANGKPYIPIGFYAFFSLYQMISDIVMNGGESSVLKMLLEARFKFLYR